MAVAERLESAPEAAVEPSLKPPARVKLAYCFGQVVESVQTVDEVMRLADRHGIELPISSLVQKVLHEDITPREGLKIILAREQKPEYPEGLFEAH